MALATFFHPTLAQTDTIVELSATESVHAIKSRRLTVGSDIQLISGQGLLAQASILETTKRSTSIRIESIQEHALTYSLTIATAIPKGDRQRTMIDMLTQVGVTEIIPLKCERSVTRFKPSMQEKWQRYAIEACKQSQNLWLPKISPEREISEVFANNDHVTIFADVTGQSITLLKDTLQDKLTVLVGPEGGFTDSEMAALKESCHPVNFGTNILRTELACVVAATQARLINF